MSINYEVMNEVPSAEEYVAMRVLAGLSPKDIKASEIGLRNSIYAVTIRNQSTLIGMGRIIGDGGCFYQIVDIAVDPVYQGQGLGKRIMTELTNFLETQVPKGAYVSLIADVPADKLYEKFGFNYTSPKSVGMYRTF
ncbi:GNAT family N-acetyltransferase [Gottfriedia solisilvae]|uniref:N-acetyltransferase n=1 Tax=Gottfriedia solisilvae TaxID=1516104 RepID=A0A8J3EXN6_9BACI|nr:GNAT family N-acetyltransferase [Gottfriedia solisilvae]GGI15200.1 N-acetyltransferase [Gottfriedia solisilvae]